MVDDIILAEQKQLSTMEKNIAELFKKETPKEVIKMRPGAGNKQFPYIPVSYTISELNRVFGIFWESVIEDVRKTDTQIIVKGKIVIKSPNGFTISRPGIGRANIKFYKDSAKPVDEGNDEKAAVSDMIKKAGSLFGIGADVYYKELEKYSEIENQQTEDEFEKQRHMAAYFAKASERGMDGELAKEKVKTAFKVKHMENLTITQLIRAITLLDQYEIVEPGEAPRKKGEYHSKITTPATKLHSDNINMDNSVHAMEGKVLDSTVKVYRCKGKLHEGMKEEDKPVVPVGQFCSQECQDSYYPKKDKKDDRPWERGFSK